jgi:hypothetical protein
MCVRTGLSLRERPNLRNRISNPDNTKRDMESKATDEHKESFLYQNYNRSVNYTSGLI